MKKLFLYLLKKYSKSEKQRIDIIKVLQKQVINDYSEQTIFGNICNLNIEFILSNDFIIKNIEENETEYLFMIKNGLINSTEEAFKYIKNEPRRKKLKKLNKK